MRNKQSGASIAQYAIVIACVMIPAVAVFSGLGKHIVSIFNQYADSYSGMSTNASQNLNDNIASASVVFDQTNSTADISRLPAVNTSTTPTTSTQVASTLNVTPSSDADTTSTDTSIDYGSYVNTGISNTYDPTVITTIDNTTPTTTIASEPVPVEAVSTTSNEPIQPDSDEASLFGGILGMILGVVTSVVNVVAPIGNAIGGLFNAVSDAMHSSGGG